MKISVKIFLASLLTAFCLQASAAVVTITGEPVVVEKRDNVYYTPTGYTTTNDYYYFTVDNNQKVCYKTSQPNLSGANVTMMNFDIGGTMYSLYCYEVTPQYFTVTTTTP